MTTLIFTGWNSAEEQADEEGEAMAVLMIHEQGIEQAGDGEAEDQDLALACLPDRQAAGSPPEDDEEGEERRETHRAHLYGDQEIFVMGIVGRKSVMRGGKLLIGPVEAAGAGAQDRVPEERLAAQAQEFETRIGAAGSEAGGVDAPRLAQLHRRVGVDRLRLHFADARILAAAMLQRPAHP